jgi:hypothetical protein
MFEDYLSQLDRKMGAKRFKKIILRINVQPTPHNNNSQEHERCIYPG